MTSTNTYTDKNYIVYHINYFDDKLPSKSDSNITSFNYIGLTSIDSNTIQTKHCKRCDTIRPITDFNKDISKPNGLSYTCKHCRKVYQDKYHPIYFQNNKSKKAEYAKNRRVIDPVYKLKCNMRTLIGNSLRKKGFKKNTKTNIILGCSYEQFIIHLENQFTDGMQWDNYGEWVIDHITPLATALTESDVITLNYYTNLQPLWASDNLTKSDKLDWIK